MPREILVDWTTANGGGKVSVFYFIAATAVASQRAALGTYLGAVDAFMDNSTSWTIRTSGRELLAATGALTGAWTEPTGQTGAGAGVDDPVADSTQVMQRWITDHIVGSRFLQGRTFLPGLSRQSLASGNLASATRTAIQTAGQTLVDAGVQLAVWHRPVLGAGGEEWAADTSVVNAELAVLRRRRY